MSTRNRERRQENAAGRLRAEQNELRRSWSHRRKLARAEAHIDHAYVLIDQWLSDGYRNSQEPDDEGHFVLLAQMVQDLPDALPLVVGDAIQCMRQSLDHIVYALSSLPGTAMTAQDEDKPQFPFPHKTAPARGNSGICFAPPDAQDDICALAPDPAAQNLTQHPLWLLNKVCNRDKHRTVAFTATVSSGVHAVRLLRSDSTDYFTDFGIVPLTVGQPPQAICVFGGSHKVNHQIDIRPQIAFDQGTEAAGREVVPMLRDIHEHIRDTVLKRLEPHLL